MHVPFTSKNAYHLIMSTTEVKSLLGACSPAEHAVLLLDVYLKPTWCLKIARSPLKTYKGDTKFAYVLGKCIQKLSVCSDFQGIHCSCLTRCNIACRSQKLINYRACREDLLRSYTMNISKFKI